MMTPIATDAESSSAMMVSVSKSVFSRSHMMPSATSRLTATMGQVGSVRPNQKPRATPVSAACEIVSLKKAMRRAVTNTPMNAQSGPRNSAASSARCMKGSVNMGGKYQTHFAVRMIHGSVHRSMSMVMVIRRGVDAVGLLERLGIHDLFGRAFTTNHAVERIDARGVRIDHREIVRHENDRELVLPLHARDEVVERFLARHVHAGGGLIEQQQF